MVALNLGMFAIALVCLFNIFLILRLKNKSYLSILNLLISLHGLYFSLTALILRLFFFEGETSTIVSFGALVFIFHVLITFLFITYIQYRKREQTTKLDYLFSKLDSLINWANKWNK